MNYKLAKQLKDAGFPLIELYKVQVGFRDKIIDIGDRKYLIPTLEELIDACRDKFEELYQDREIKGKYKNYWLAGGFGKRIECPKCHTWKIENVSGIGKTPKIAVAKLWLKLNAK